MPCTCTLYSEFVIATELSGLSQKSQQFQGSQIFYGTHGRRTPHKSTDAAISICNPHGDNSPFEGGLGDVLAPMSGYRQIIFGNQTFNNPFKTAPY